MKKDIESYNDIKTLVDNFYAKVRNDDYLAVIFNKVIGDDWDKHLQKMYRFWETLLFNKQSYKGAPFPKHIKLPVQEVHFDRWLELFHQTIDHNFEGKVADMAKDRSQQIANVFKYKLGIKST